MKHLDNNELGDRLQLNINKHFDYWEIDKEKLFIEME